MWGQSGSRHSAPDSHYEKTGVQMSHYLLETFDPAGPSHDSKPSPRHTSGGSYEISCSRTAALAKPNRGHSVSGCRLDGGSGGEWGRLVGAPDRYIRAHVREALLPGGTIFDDTHSVTGALTTPTQSAEYLYRASKGENLSGRSTNIQGAFAVGAKPQSNCNGGVGRHRSPGLKRKSEQHQCPGDRATRLRGHLEAELYL